MPVFKYRGKNKIGSIIEGERNGRNANEIVTALEKEQIQVLSIERKKLKFSIPFIGGRKSVCGSAIGSPGAISEMLALAAAKGITTLTEPAPMADADTALDRTRHNRALYRMVLVN